MAKTVSKRKAGKRPGRRKTKKRKSTKTRRKLAVKKKPAPKPLLTLPPAFEPGHVSGAVRTLVARFRIPKSFEPGHGGGAKRAMAKKRHRR